MDIKSTARPAYSKISLAIVSRCVCLHQVSCLKMMHSLEYSWWQRVHFVVLLKFSVLCKYFTRSKAHITATLKVRHINRTIFEPTAVHKFCKCKDHTLITTGRFSIHTKTLRYLLMASSASRSLLNRTTPQSWPRISANFTSPTTSRNLSRNVCHVQF